MAGIATLFILGLASAAFAQGLDEFYVGVEAGDRLVELAWDAIPEVEDVLFGGYNVWRSEIPSAATFMLMRRFQRRYPVAWTYCGANPWPECGGVTVDTVREFADADSIVDYVKIEISAQGDSALTREYVGVPPHNGFPYYYAVSWFSECLSDRNDTLSIHQPQPEFFGGYETAEGDSVYSFEALNGDTLQVLRITCREIDLLTGAGGDTVGVFIHTAEAQDPLRLYAIEATRSREPIFPSTVAQTDLRTVRAIPNPYDQRADWDEPGQRKIQFINLTADATIRIYTVGGDLVRRLDHPATGAEYGLGSVDWDLKNGAGELVVPGIYIFHAESPDHLVNTQGRLIIVY